MSFGQKFLVIVLIAAMVLGIIYVGNRQNRQEEEIKENAYHQVEVVNFWYSDDRYTDFFTKAAVDFHEKNPDIRVIPSLVSSSEYLEKINEASLSNENFPDLYLISNDSLEKAYLSGLASEAKNTCNVLNTAHFSQSALDAVTYKNCYVAYPLSFETSVLLYNKTLLQNWVDKYNAGLVEENLEGFTLDELQIEEGDEIDLPEEGQESETVEAPEKKKFITLEDVIPEDFDKLLEVSQTYQAEEGVEGVLKWDVSDIFYNYLFVGNYMIVGGNSGDDTGNIDINNEDTLKCLNLYQNLNQVFSIDPATSDYPKMLEDFLDGKIVFTIATSDCIEKIEKRMEEGEIARAEAEAAAAEAALNGDVSSDDVSSNDEESEDKEELPEEYTPKHIQTEEEPKKYFDYGYAIIPDISAELASRSLSVTDALVINGYSSTKKAADKFAAYLSTECAPDLYTRTGRLSAAKDAGYSDDGCRVFQREYSESIPLPKIVEASNLWVQLEIAFQDIWTGTDVSKRLKDLSDQISSQIITTE